MSGKSLINDVDNAVLESLSGLSYLYPQIELHKPQRVALSSNYKNNGTKVAIVSGGGGGHEPFSAGFVGTGMLNASVTGSIFAAPPSKHIAHALQCIAKYNKAGILVVVPNYTGDRLNFGIAIEKFKQDQCPISELIMGDDCSIPKEEMSLIGKRGLVGMLFVFKICGALAERSKSLSEITQLGEIVMNNIATYAVGLTPCSIPGQPLAFDLPENLLECGMGVHGEAGYERIQLGKTSEVVAYMLERIFQALTLDGGDDVAVIVNNFGTLSQLEQGIVVHEVVTQLKNKNIEPVRVYAGALMTSLNGSGIHVSILKLMDSYKSILIDCLDDQTEAPCWPGRASIGRFALNKMDLDDRTQPTRSVENLGRMLNGKHVGLMKLCLENASKMIIDEEIRLNELDQGCGDGDCGTTLKRLAQSILLNVDRLSLSYPCTLLFQLANITEDKMGGTSGAMYCLFFTSAAQTILKSSETNWPVLWACAFRNGLRCIMKYGKGQVGDRTMLDPMDAACTTFEKSLGLDVDKICQGVEDAVWKGCEATKHMKPKVGRASYVKNCEFLQNVDAGAYGAGIWISSIARTINNVQL